jgi:mitogen-activated protein kinase organizer 1
MADIQEELRRLLGEGKGILLWCLVSEAPGYCLWWTGTELKRGSIYRLVLILDPSGSNDTKVMIWDTKANSPRPIQVLEDAKDAVSSIQVKGHEIVAGSVDGRVRSYDIRMGTVGVDVIGGPVTSVSRTKAGDATLVTVLPSATAEKSSKGKHLLLSTSTGQLLQSFTASTYTHTSLRLRSAFALHDAYVLSGSEDGVVYVWDVLSGDVKHKLEPKPYVAEEGKRQVVRLDAEGNRKKSIVTDIAVHPRGETWLGAGTDGSVSVWSR